MSRPRPSRASGGPSPSALPISAPFATRRAGGFLRHAAVAALAGAIPWLTAALLVAAPAVAQQEDEDEGRPTIEAKTEGMEKLDGFVPLYWDADEGKLWMEVARWDEEILYYVSLPQGLGQNDLGLNRGDLGPRHVFEFRRVGPRVLMVEPNYGFRADTEDPLERRAVADAFAPSVLWGFEVEAETGARALVDATEFVLRDAHDVAGSLRRSDQGTFSLEESRSALHLPRTKAFPQNTEIEAMLTFTSDRPGGLVRSVAATAGAITVRQHHSFVELPTGYEPREADPRAGYGGISYMDYAAPLGADMTRRFIRRHRLEKQDPTAERGPPVEPIVYYLDPGTPEPVRSALIEGASWWNEAFEVAGYVDAFRVEILPEDADPMDVRYNVIQWVHRSTRGWSYGSSVSDPRTGEILKGHVTLGSLRVRQDYLIFEGLLSPYDQGTEEAAMAREAALARIRQLSAHEVGHTIGLSHNYISSAQGPDGRASVMDYPHPLARLNPDGSIDLWDAYDTGIGEWDEVAIAYGYTDFPPGTAEAVELERILDEARARGITFISDQDARPAGSAHPQVHLWDNGTDAAVELERVMNVRRAALDRFGVAAIQRGRPLATLEEALVPLYLHHRYQTEAAVKPVAGLYYTYALRGDDAEPPRPVPATEQTRALEALFRTLAPSELTVPEAVLDHLPPRPHGYGMHRELFPRYTGLVFDAVSPAVVASDHTLSLLLHPQRAARLVQQKARHPSLPGLDDVLGGIRAATFGAGVGSEYEAEVNRAVERVYVDRLMQLASAAEMPQVRALATAELAGLRSWLADGAQRTGSEADRAHYSLLVSDIERWRERPFEAEWRPSILDMPPGSPIGGGGFRE